MGLIDLWGMKNQSDCETYLVKYTTEGKIAVSCRAKSTDEPGVPPADSGFVQMEIIVADTGCGIPAEKLQAMFVSLEQAESDTGGSHTGLGKRSSRLRTHELVH